MDRRVLFEVAEATWPAARYITQGPWVFRQSDGGGKRVTATSTEAEVGRSDIEDSEAQMKAMGQRCLFSVSPGQAHDAVLEDMGYALVDPTRLYHCPIDLIAALDLPLVTAFPIWPPLHLMRNIWDEGGIGPDRVAVMERASCDKTGILGRVNDRAGGVVYAGLHQGCVMIHALEILQAQRRSGLARSLMTAAARWGADRGATDFALLVTKGNMGANALYTSLGMTAQDGYHYRIEPQKDA